MKKNAKLTPMSKNPIGHTVIDTDGNVMGHVIEYNQKTGKAIIEDYTDDEEICIGIICYDIYDFARWLRVNEKHSESNRHCGNFKIGNIMYRKVSSPTDLCSVRFDEVIETEDARDNPEYDEIKRGVSPCMNIKNKKREI